MRLAAKIDQLYVQKDFFDSDIELIPVSDGRTRCLLLWRAGRMIWPRACFRPGDSMGIARCRCGLPICCSSPAMRPTQTDSILPIARSRTKIIPTQCLKMTRDLYRFQAGEWKRIETGDLGPAKASAK